MKQADYVIIGAGKTAMDSCLFLLQNGVNPANITWIMPRDSWLLDRAALQPGALFHESLGEYSTRQVEAIAAANSAEDVLERVEKTGLLMRFSDDVWPTMYRCATVTREEFHTMGRLTDLMASDKLTDDIGLEAISPERDRFMICGSPSMLTDFTAMLDERGFRETRNGEIGHYVIERAFVEQ